MRESGYPEDDAYPGTFEWWRHKGTGVVVAVRLDRSGEVTGTVRPLREEDLVAGSAKGFMWDESTALRNHVRRRQAEFERIGDWVRRPLDAQRVKESDLNALG